jgi:hypothetical protein
MKTLFCCGTATHTSQGQAGLWRWWYYYRPLASQFGATHFAVNNDGCGNLPNETFVRRIDGSAGVDRFTKDQLNFIFWPTSLPRIDQFTCPGYYRSLYTLSKAAREQDFDKLIFIDWDFWVFNVEMMREIAAIDHGLVAYWVPRYLFAESNLIICGKDHFTILEDAAQINASSPRLDIKTIAENGFPWTEVRKHRVGDRYPEYTMELPMGADYCAQLPLDEVIHNQQIVRIAQQLCKECGHKIEFNKKGILACAQCRPEQFAELDPFELHP